MLKIVAFEDIHMAVTGSRKIPLVLVSDVPPFTIQVRSNRAAG
jgi:hypothetical protein